MDSSFPFLLAVNWDELISFGVGLVFLLVWLVNQISDAKKKKAGPPAIPPAEPEPVEAAAGNAPQPVDPLRTQIDEFLRRVQQQAKAATEQMERKPAPAEPRRPVRDEIEVLIEEPRPETRRPSRAPAVPLVGNVAAQQRKQRREKAKAQHGKSVAEHVAERVGTSSQAMRAEVAHLGERVIQADKQFDAQLQQKFDHQLGSLGERATSDAYDKTQADAAISPAAQIAAMLATPEGVRQAIVLNEILRRPEDRW